MKRSQMIATRSEIVAENGMAVGGDQREADAGVRILQEGGNAVDALVAAAFTGYVVEPASCGIGGYGRLSVFLGERQEYVTIDHYMRAPLKAHPHMFEVEPASEWHNYGHPRTRGRAAEKGYLSMGVPGAVAGLCAAHEMFGRLSLAQVLEPAIEIAEAGVPVTWYMAMLIGNILADVQEMPHLADFLLRDGRPPRYGSSWSPGDTLDTSDLARTLRLIAEQGPNAFYSGPVAEAIEREVTGNGGILTAADLAAYRPKIMREKLAHYRDLDYIAAYDQITYETLNILDQFDLASYGPDSVEYRHLAAEAMGHAFIDSKVHYGDPEHTSSPVNGLTSREFAAARARGLSLQRAAPRPIEAADPWPYETEVLAPEVISTSPTLAKVQGTSQMATADREGNFCALITSLSGGYGSKVMVPGTGIILNNSMQNFDPRPDHPNRVQPGKLPIFAAPPLVASRNGRGLFAGCGSGGYRIMTGVLHTFMNAVDFGMGIQQALDAPRVHCQGDKTVVDARIPADVRERLAAMGHQVETAEDEVGQNPFGRINAIWRDPDSGAFHSGSGPAWNTGAAGY